MKKYIFFVISACIIFGLLLFGVYYQGSNILSRVISVGEDGKMIESQESIDDFEMFGISERSYHKIGTGHAGKKSWFTTPQDGAGFLTYGPYTQLKPGYYQAIFDLQIYDETLNSDEIIRIEVYDPFNVTKIAEKIITRDEFRTSLKKQNFVLPFKIEEPQILEFRVYVFGKSYVEHLKTAIVRDDERVQFLGNDRKLMHQIGDTQGSSWKAKASDGSGYITRGPYIQHLLADVHTASFQLSIGSKVGPNDIVAELEIFDTITQTIIKKRIIKRSHFYEANKSQDFDVEFEIPEKTTLELRVKVSGKADIIHHKTQLYSDKVTMNDLWYEKAHFDFYDKKAFVSPLKKFPELLVPNEPSTAPIYTLDGVWYSFNRQRLKEKFPGCTKNIFTFRTVVRKSIDQGKTWSEPVLIDPPTGPTDGMCSGTDGSMYFDIETGIWHFITQCIPKEGGWGLCHYTRDSISPMGTFTPNPQNPVVKGGMLFQKLCREMGNKCPELIKPNPNNDGNPAQNRLGMIEEGTPQIVKKQNGYFYVTYHGAHYQTEEIIRGGRAIAKTKDFINWEVTGDDLPNNLMLSNADCASWNPDGEIGAGTQIRSGGFDYVLSECPDKSIGSIVNQNWYLGLTRHPKYGRAGTWGNYAYNPLITSSHTLLSDPLGRGASRLGYGRIFRERGSIYMGSLSKSETNAPGMPLYLFKLTPGKGPLNYLIPGDYIDENPTDFVQE